jgi:tetratricopeptide (TPR) repeat protein
MNQSLTDNSHNPRINLAIEYAKRAIKINQENGFAYATLAEAYAVLTKDEEFYDNFEEALRLGFPFWETLDEPCFEKYKSEERLQFLLGKYQNSHIH